MTYENMSGILADVVSFIKSFVYYMKLFINGFKTEYSFRGDEYPEDDEG